MGLRSLMDPGDWLATKPKLDPHATPIEFHYRPDPFEVKARVLIGVGVAGVASLGGYLLREEGFAVFVAGGFGVMGFLLAAYGMLQSRFSISVVITGLEVVVEKETIWGKAKWRESVHHYQGVLLREEEFEQQGGKIRTVKRYGIVELVHANPRLNVVLYVKEGGDPPSAIQEAFARRFHLPELEQGFDGKVAPERRRLTLDPGPAPKGVMMDEAEGVTRFWLERAGAMRVVVWASWSALPVVFGYLTYQIEPSLALIAAGAAAVFALFQVGMGEMARKKVFAAEPRLCVGGRAIWLARAGEEPRTKIRFDEVEQVRLGRVKGQAGGGVRLIVEGGGKRIEMAAGQFDRKRMEWLREKVAQMTGRIY